MIGSTIRRAVRERVLYPIAGRTLEHIFRRWCIGRDERARLASIIAHTMLETTPAFELRVQIAESLMVAGPYLGPKSVEILVFIDEIAKKHSFEAN